MIFEQISSVLVTLIATAGLLIGIWVIGITQGKIRQVSVILTGINITLLAKGLIDFYNITGSAINSTTTSTISQTAEPISSLVIACLTLTATINLKNITSNLSKRR